MNDPTRPDMFGHFEMPSTKAKQRTWMDWLLKRNSRYVIGEIQKLIAQCGVLSVEEMRVRLRAMEREAQGMGHALVAIRAELHNRGPVERAEPVSDKFDDDKIAEIIAVKEANPDLPQHVIANMTNVNGGRVNNALRGVRR